LVIFAIPMVAIWLGWVNFLPAFAVNYSPAVTLGRDNNSKLANIIPIGSDQYQLPAKRPKNSGLSSEKIMKNFMIKTLDWQKALEYVWC